MWDVRRGRISGLVSTRLKRDKKIPKESGDIVTDLATGREKGGGHWALGRCDRWWAHIFWQRGYCGQILFKN